MRVWWDIARVSAFAPGADTIVYALMVAGPRGLVPPAWEPRSEVLPLTAPIAAARSPSVWRWVLVPPIFPGAANWGCVGSCPTGTLPRRLGRVKVVVPSPGP